MRTYFDRPATRPLTLEIGSDRVVFEDCVELARTGSVLANIHEYLLQTPERRIVKVTIVADEDQEFSRAILKGWYVARFVSQAEGSKIRTSWSMLHDHSAVA
jgi:hypothetical protein